jgi:hypothetical protein
MDLSFSLMQGPTTLPGALPPHWLPRDSWSGKATLQSTLHITIVVSNHWGILMLYHRFSLSDTGASLAIRLLQQSEGSSDSQPSSSVSARSHTRAVHSPLSATTSQLPGRKRHSPDSSSRPCLSPAKKSCSLPRLGRNSYSPTRQSQAHCIVLGEH